MMQERLYYQWFIYSIDNDLTCSLLQSWNYSKNISTETLERWLVENNVKFVVAGMESYHYKFSLLKSSPYIVYYSWDISLLYKPLLSIVGPRLKTHYADKVLEKLFTILPKYDLVTVSGLADGVDWMVHQLSIENKIPTIAVLWAGLWAYMQSSSRSRYDKILQSGGLIISEFPLKMRSTRYSFPQRNRIIAGLGDALFLPEAAEWSGSLITVDFAIKMNKPIFATPNSIFAPSSSGINNAIQDWKIIAVADLELFVSKYFSKKETEQFVKELSLTSSQKKIIDILESSNWPITLEQLMSFTKLQHSKILADLSILEMEGLVYEDSLWWFGMKDL